MKGRILACDRPDQSKTGLEKRTLDWSHANLNKFLRVRACQPPGIGEYIKAKSSVGRSAGPLRIVTTFQPLSQGRRALPVQVLRPEHPVHE